MEFISEKVVTVDQSVKPSRFFGDKLIGLSRTYTRNDQHIEFSVYDFNGDQQKQIRLELASRPGRSCGLSIEELNRSYAIIKRGCGHYSVIDIENGKVAFDIPPYRDADFLYFALTENYLLVRPLPYGERRYTEPLPVSVFDLPSGRELSKLLLPKGKLHTAGGKLFIENVDRQTLSTSVYSLNERALLDENRAASEIRQLAAQVREMDDPYAALDAFEAISLTEMRQAPEKFLGEADLYGRLLAYNPRTSGEGAEFIRHISEMAPASASVKALLEQSEERSAIFSTDSLVREATLSKIWATAENRPLLSARTGLKNINFGAFSSQIYFNDDRVYIACYACDERGLVAVEVYKRDSWEHVATVPVIRPGGEKQENISAIAFSSDKMFVSLANRYPDESDTNIYVFDLHSLQPVKSWHDGTNGALFVSGEDYIGICNCNTEKCRRIDVNTLLPFDEETFARAACTNPYRQSKTTSPDVAEKAKGLPDFAAYVSDKYFVIDVATHPLQKYEFHSINEEAEPTTFPIMVTHLAWRQLYFSSQEDFVAIGDRNMDSVKFYGFNLSDQSYRTLIEMPSEKYQGAASDGKSLFLAFDGSVLVIDMRSGAVYDFSYVFEDSSDRNKPIISRMLVDRDTLVVLARGGKAATFNLSKFYSRSNARETPYWKSSKELNNWRH
jgi:hypothetical protein